MFNPLRGKYSSVLNLPLLVSVSCSPSINTSATSVLSVTRPDMVALEPFCLVKADIVGIRLSVLILCCSCFCLFSNTLSFLRSSSASRLDASSSADDIVDLG